MVSKSNKVDEKPTQEPEEKKDYGKGTYTFRMKRIKTRRSLLISQHSVELQVSPTEFAEYFFKVTAPEPSDLRLLRCLIVIGQVKRRTVSPRFGF